MPASEVGTRAFMAGILAGRFTRELVGERFAQIDLLALRDQIALILNVEYGLGAAIGHVPIWAEDGQLVLQGRHVEGFIASVVVGRHHVSDLLRRMRVDPLQRLDVGVHQLLDDVFVAVDVIVFHKDADEGVGPAESRLGRLRCAQVYQDFSNTARYEP